MISSKPFRLSARLLTPIVVKRNSVNLASLLYHACLMHTCDPLKASKMVDSLLKVTEGVHHASNMVFSVSRTSPLIALNLKISGVMRQERDFSKSLISPNGTNGKYKKVITSGGVYKARLDSHRSYHTDLVYFYGNGDAKQICRLLNHYVFSLGVFSNRGSGSISEFLVEDMKDDHSMIRPDDDGKLELMRKLPKDSSALMGVDVERYDLQMARIIPPFYCGEEVEAYFPSAILLYKNR